MMRYVPLCLIVMLLIVFLYFDTGQYLIVSSFKEHRALLLHWTQDNYLKSVLYFMCFYILLVATSLPGAFFMTIIAGMMFGFIWGTTYVIISATIGAMILFLSVRTAFEPWLAKKAKPWVNKIRVGFQEGGVNYLLFLRLVPLFPFWAVNIACALLGVRPFIFLMTTFLGIIPGTMIYVWLGTNLDPLANMSRFFLPLTALAFLILLPRLYQLRKRKKQHA